MNTQERVKSLLSQTMAALANLQQETKPSDTTVLPGILKRHIAICITEQEKIYAYFRVYVEGISELERRHE